MKASFAHALLEPLHYHLIRCHPRATRTIFLLHRWGKPESLAPRISNDISVGFGAQRRAIDCVVQ